MTTKTTPPTRKKKPPKKSTKPKRKTAIAAPEPRIIIPLFKVLVDGKSCHGGNADYPPIGEWTKPVEPSCCSTGWHLTSDPLRWWKPKATLWLCEAETPISGDGEDKAAFRRVRRIMEITHTWPYLPMFPRVRCFLAAAARSVDKDADISYASLSGANLSRADLSGANLSGANLSGANLSRANLSYANLSRASLSYADLSGADLSGADLSGANLSGANLSGANLSGADLSGADLSGADLSGANLSGANLSGANLSGADLSGADLSYANLSGAFRPEGGIDGYKVVNNRLEKIA